jgi:8-oxo-dGTP pyrophosphatase MutT (NUDIX family)
MKLPKMEFPGGKLEENESEIECAKEKLKKN